MGDRLGTYVGNVTIDKTNQGEQTVYVPWSEFKLTWRGEDLKGPALSDDLGKIMMIGFATGYPGKVGGFDINLLSFEAGNSDDAANNNVEFKKGARKMTVAGSDYVDLVTFDGQDGTTFKWRDLNDPVMGGRSVSTFEVDNDGQYAVFNGTVAIVPSLSAPGTFSSSCHFLIFFLFFF